MWLDVSRLFGGVELGLEIRRLLSSAAVSAADMRLDDIIPVNVVLPLNR